MVKRVAFLCISAIIINILFAVSVFASPDAVAPCEEGNVNDLIVITKPENQTLTTFDRVCFVSGYGKEGTVVTFYSYSADDEVYKKMWSGEEEVSLAIGASSLFMKNIDLVSGKNEILLYAEYWDGTYQIVKLEVRAVNYNLIEIIKSLAK